MRLGNHNPNNQDNETTWLDWDNLQRNQDLNAAWNPLVSSIQSCRGERWAQVIDTSRESPDDFVEEGAEAPVDALTYLVQPRSTVVLIV